jgi:hypothetical protein
MLAVMLLVDSLNFQFFSVNACASFLYRIHFFFFFGGKSVGNKFLQKQIIYLKLKSSPDEWL